MTDTKHPEEKERAVNGAIMSRLSRIMGKGTPVGPTGRTVWAPLSVTVVVLGCVLSYCFWKGVEPLVVFLLAFIWLLLVWGIFWWFRRDILGSTVFERFFVFGPLDDETAANAARVMEEIRAACLQLAKEQGFDGDVRSNVFRPLDELVGDGCAYVLRIDPMLRSEKMKQAEIFNLRFVPGEGHTGVAFAQRRVSKGIPEEHINPFQFGQVAENLKFIMSFPLQASTVVGVLNIDFLDQEPNTSIVQSIEQMVQQDARLSRLSNLLGQGKRTFVRIVKGEA